MMKRLGERMFNIMHRMHNSFWIACVIGPALEELIFRNCYFSMQAQLIGSILFVIQHIPNTIILRMPDLMIQNLCMMLILSLLCLLANAITSYLDMIPNSLSILTHGIWNYYIIFVKYKIVTNPPPSRYDFEVLRSMSKSEAIAYFDRPMFLKTNSCLNKKVIFHTVDNPDKNVIFKRGTRTMFINLDGSDTVRVAPFVRFNKSLTVD